MSESVLQAAQATTSHTAATHQAQHAMPPGGGFSTILMLAAFVVIFYFLIWRPQSKRQKEQRDLLGALKKGDEVVTSGGIVGRINKLTDDFLVININDGNDIKIQRSAVASVLPKGTFKSI